MAAPDLNDIRFFAEVVEAGSFSGAARAFGVPTSTVSRRVARLERRIGLRLLHRTTRKLALTDAGRSYHAHAERALAEIDAAEALASALQAEPRGRVRITTAAGLVGALWPLVGAFLDEHPGVGVDLSVSERFVDLVEEGFDLAVRAGVLPDSGMVARQLSTAHNQLFASPRYLRGAGRLSEVGDLSRHQCIVTGSSAAGATWVLFEGRRSRTVPISARVAVSDLHLSIDAAVRGLGIVRAPAELVAAHVSGGELVRVLPAVHAGEGAVWLIYPDRRHLPAAVRRLIDHLVQHAPARLGVDPAR